MARHRAGPAGLSAELIERAHQCAERSCADQGLQTKITDPATLAKVVALLGPAIAAKRETVARPRAAKRSRRAQAETD